MIGFFENYISMRNDHVYGDPEYSWREYITKCSLPIELP